MDDDIYDPFDPEIQRDPYPTYRLLRDHYPLYRCQKRSSWVLSRHADVDMALTDPERFSSAHGVFPTRMGTDMTTALLPMLITTDPPRHTQLRALVNKGFTPRRMADLETSVRALTKELLDSATSGDSCDIVEQVAGPLPALVIADLLGVPRADRDQFRSWSSTLVQSDPADKSSSGSGLAAAASLYAYLGAFIDEKRRNPSNDLLSVLAHAEIDGQRLADTDLLGFAFLLLIAGHETTTNLIANSIALLAEAPDTRRSLCNDPRLLPPAVDELVRFDSPVQGLARTLTTDVAIHDQTMRAGDTALLLFGAANRDGRAFTEPDTLDIRRQAEHQVAFGRGIHYCLGSSLARLETRVFFEAFLQRVPEWNVDIESATRVRSGPLRGYTSLPITW